jgi:hypothetical protein
VAVPFKRPTWYRQAIMRIGLVRTLADWKSSYIARYYIMWHGKAFIMKRIAWYCFIW